MAKRLYGPPVGDAEASAEPASENTAKPLKQVW
jgi:hypothetical protein